MAQHDSRIDKKKTRKQMMIYMYIYIYVHIQTHTQGHFVSKTIHKNLAGEVFKKTFFYLHLASLSPFVFLSPTLNNFFILDEPSNKP